jgi:hypothetical protein
MNLVQNAYDAPPASPSRPLHITLWIDGRATATLREIRLARQRPGHRGRAPAAHVRALLHHQAGGQGHGAGAVHQLRHRRAAWRQLLAGNQPRCTTCTSRLGATHGALRRLCHAGAVPRRHPGRAPSTARDRPRCSTCRTWASCACAATTPPPRWKPWCRGRGRPGPGRQRYAFFTNASGGLLDDLMIVRPTPSSPTPPVPTTCSWSSMPAARTPTSSHLQTHIGHRCQVVPMPDARCWRCRAPRRWTRWRG